jgi:peptidoglycan/xylan/chitin deacetylase (PgdA/CDA1 family)
VLTFDDGLLNNYTKAFPILRKYSLTATIFVITDFVGQTKYMDWHQLREMSEAGISIQSHTVSHKPLTGLAYEQLMHELSASKKTLEDHLGKHVNFLSLPHGIFNRKVLETAQKAGYQAVCTSDPGFSHLHSSISVLKRINISDHFQIDIFKKILRKDSSVILPLLVSKKIKNLARRLLGYSNYRKLYQTKYQIRD